MKNIIFFLLITILILNNVGCRSNDSTKDISSSTISTTITSTISTTTEVITPSEIVATSTISPTMTTITTTTHTTTPLHMFGYWNKTYYYNIAYPVGYSVTDTNPDMVLIENNRGIGGITIIVDKVSVTASPMDYLKQKQLSDWTYSSQTTVSENGEIIGYTFDYKNTVNGEICMGKGMVVKKGGLGFYFVFTLSEKEWDDNSVAVAKCIDSIATPRIAVGDYLNTSLGLSVTLPTGWCVVEPVGSSAFADTSVTLPSLVFIAPYDQTKMCGYLYIWPETLGKTAEQRLIDLAQLLTVIERAQVTNKQALIFNNGAVGYEIRLLSAQKKSIYIALMNGNKYFHFEFEESPADFDSLANSFELLVRSLVVT